MITKVSIPLTLISIWSGHWFMCVFNIAFLHAELPLKSYHSILSYYPYIAGIILISCGHWDTSTYENVESVGLTHQSCPPGHPTPSVPLQPPT